MSKQLYHNMGNLVRLILRRDRIRIPIWIIAISLITLIIANAFTGLYPTEQDRQAVATTMSNPAITAMLGPAYGIDNYTPGAMMAHQMLLFTALAVAIMSILLVTRHSRADEESGRIEIIRSLPAGRLSNLSATLCVQFGTNIFLALIVGFGLSTLDINSIDLEGSLIYGAALGATGIIFAAITALFAQLTESSRGTLGYSFAFLVLAYLFRAIGDVSSETLALVSPLGLILRSEVYVNNYWWPILLTLGIALGITVLSLYLNSIRDLGAGFIPAKPGRKTASIFLQSPLGLGLRLQRTGIISWAIGMFVLGASYGSVLGDLETYLESNEMLQKVLTSAAGFSLTEQFITVLMVIISIICTIPALLMILKLRGEEKKNRTEHLLARAVSRTRVLGSYLLISVVGGFIMLFLAVVGLWAAAAGTMEEPIAFIIFFKGAMVYLPAMWTMIGLAVLLIGFMPQRTVLTWLYLGYSFFVVYLGGMLQLPDWMAKLSPFGNIPKIPVEALDWSKLSVLSVIAVLLVIIGCMGYNKRDLQG